MANTLKFLTPKILEDYTKLKISITNKFKGGYYIGYKHKQILLILKIEYVEEIKKDLKYLCAKLDYETIKKRANKNNQTFYFAIYSFKKWKTYFILKNYFNKNEIRSRYLTTSKKEVKAILQDYENESRN